MLARAMTRREFACAAASFAAWPAAAGEPLVYLNAFAAQQLPHRIAIPARLVAGKHGILELRTYQDAPAARLARTLAQRSGIRAVLWRKQLVLTFDSEAARSSAWRELNASAEWTAVRETLDVSYRFSLYRLS
jgi:hypothetical protein